MTMPLNLLIVEDSQDDAELMVRELRRAGFDPKWKRVEREADFLAEIAKGPDVVLSDYSMPHLSGLRAAQLLQESGLAIPFLLVSGTVGEDRAVEAMKGGATDYLLKDRMARLGSAVQRALEQKQLRQQREQAEKELRQSEEKFRQLAENINEVFWITDPARRQMLYVSPAYEKIWGRTCQSIYQSPQSWAEAIDPEDRPWVLEAWSANQERGEYDETYRIVRPDGAVRWIRDRGFPVRDAAGRTYRIVGTAEDITAHKNLETQFMRAQRLENIGTLAGGIAHDLNNVLTPILMSCELLQMRERDADTRKLLGRIKGSAERGAELVKQVLSFARGVEGRRMAVQPRHLIREMVNIARETFPKSIRIHSQLPDALWVLSGDPTQLHQVLLNLCVNARDAMPAGGELRITAENVLLKAGGASVNPQAKPGPYLLIKVTDTGTGVAAEVREKIFEPFFTTKETGKGTGLGLSTSLGIVKSHGGFITLNSAPGEGAVFEVWLPAQAAENPPSSQAEEAQFLRGRGELILVADDEAAVRALTKQTLEAYGYAVLTAANGAEAVSLYARQKDEIEVVVTDLMMPVMDGVALMRVLRTINPAVSAIVLSGSNNAEERAKALEAGAKKILPKPYPVETLLASLYEIVRNR